MSSVRRSLWLVSVASSLQLQLLSSTGARLSSEEALGHLEEAKEAALYFSAGWCPMCRSFEPSLAAFRAAAPNVVLIYVSSDRTVEDQRRRAEDLGVLQVDPEEATALKKRFRVWAGLETPTFGPGRRSGVPAIVVLDEAGNEKLFLDAETHGAKVLSDWADSWNEA
mmetsp:Transcript_16993/g.55267  ORF Transcript_16993/g.55267 Transcript_16993/m.55267 type:complete len:167 (+) Transcript_16993:146-646(+)